MAGVALAILLALAGGAAASVLVTVDEALELAFPSAETVRETVFLTEAQIDRVAVLGGGRPSGAIVTRYRAERNGAVVGWAYLDTHRVRTLPETVMIVVKPDGGVARVEVVAFREPLEYLPREAWYGQFENRELDDQLQLDRAIRPVTGATLTATATTEAVRRILAIHAVLADSGGP